MVDHANRPSEEPLPLRAELQATLNIIPAYTWYAVPSGALTFVNQRCADYMGLPPDHPLRFGIETGAAWDSHLAFLHPEDHEDSRKVWSTCLSTGSAGRGYFRLLGASGTYRWFQSRVEPLRANDGTLLYWVGINFDIEDHKQAELQREELTEELRRSEFYLAEAQRLTHTGSAGWNVVTDEFSWSEENYRILGYERSVKPTFELIRDRVHPDDLGMWQEAISQGLEGNQIDFEHRLLMPDGSVKYLHVVTCGVQKDGKLVELIGTARDITESKRTEGAMRRSEAYLAEAQRLSHTGSFGWNVSTGEIYWSDETFRIFELDPKTEITIDLIVQRTHPDDRQAVQQIIERASSERKEFALEHRLLMPDGSIKYLHVVGHPSTDERDTSEFVGAVTDITDQRRAEESLRISKAYLSEAQRLSHTGSFAWSPVTDNTYYSDECYRLLGFEPQGGLPPKLESIFERIDPADHPHCREMIAKALRDKVDVEIDYRIVLPNKQVRSIHCVCHVVFDQSGEVDEIIGTVIDVTERKRAEEGLRASEAKYRHLVDTTPAFIRTTLPNGDCDFCNRGWLEYVGLNFTDLLGWGWTGMIHPQDLETIMPKWRAALESGEPFVGESRVRRADGEYRWFLHRDEPLRNKAGEIVKWYGSSIEIQERKIAEEKVQEQEAELRQILDLTPLMVAVIGVGGERLYANRVALDYLGLGLEEWRQTPGGLFTASRFIHPDDQETVARSYSDGVRSGGSGFEVEIRVQRADGSYRWVLSRCNPVRDEHGQIVRWYVASTDIEERKRAEEKVQQENVALREEIIKTSMFEEIVGNSTALQQVLDRVAKVAPTDSTVLITGETGTGKELIARAIHKASKRSDRAFVSVNCAAIPPSLIPSELFGHEKGAFTGATQRRLGRFELAEGGTIFLDEVGELPPETQVAILRVLQEREFERVGGNRSIKTNVRVIVATNRDLPAAIIGGTFRQDLFYRLNVFPIEIPPLRERRDDIPMLVQYFIDRYARKAGKNISRVNKQTLDLFQGYTWPGNVRELQNVIERSVIVCEGESFSVDESWLSRQPPQAQSPTQLELRQRLASEEKEAIEAALMESRGRVFGPSGAAARLGIARSTLDSKIKTLKIDKNRFKLSNPS